MKFRWEEVHRESLVGLKKFLISPQIMVPPQAGIPLQLYITSTTRSIGPLLAQEIDGQERPIYYLSRLIHGPEIRYSSLERHCFALVFVAQKLRHYMLSFTIHIVTRCDPIKYLLARTILFGRAARWFLILSEYDLKCVIPHAIKSQAYADLLAILTSGTFEPPKEDIPRDDLQANYLDATDEEWMMQFNGSSTKKKGGAGVILSKGMEEIFLSYKLDFPFSNDETEYEALVLGCWRLFEGELVHFASKVIRT